MKPVAPPAGAVARHHGFGVLVGDVEQRALRGLDRRERLVDRGTEQQAHVGRDLVVAAAAGVQPLAGLADDLGQAPLDVEVHVFVGLRPRKGAGADLGADLREALLDRREVALADDVRRVQHARVRYRGFDVELGKPQVEGDRSGEALRERSRRLAEAPRPRLFLGFIVGGHAAC